MRRWPTPEPQSALIVPIPEAEELVAGFRAAHDPAAAAGVPAHITILYPFRPPTQIDYATTNQLKACFRSFTPFDFKLTRVGRLSGVIYLSPEPDGLLKSLTLVVWKAFPECPPYEGRHPDIIPHLSVASEADEQVLGCIASEFRRVAERFLPIAVETKVIALIDNRAGRWQIFKTFPLGRS